MKKYKLIQDGTNLPIAYGEKTPDELIKHLEYARKNRSKIKIYLGDSENGRDWMEEMDKTGTIGLSRGKDARYPLLIKTKRSYGGGSLMDDCIVKLKIDDVTVYQHPNYNQPTIEIAPSDLAEYTHNVLINGQIYSRHKSERSAKNLVAKLL